jgi:signal transduction histidine kinase
MKIKNRLSLQFTLISAVLLLLVLTGIWLLAVRYRKNDFRERLLDRAVTKAELFLAKDNLSEENFKDVQKRYFQSLQDEVVQIYDDNYESVFIKDTAAKWPKKIIDQVRKQKVLFLSDGYRQTVGIYYIDNSGNYTVLASAVDHYGQDEMRQLFWVMLIAFFISVFILFFSGRLFARIALSPIIKVIRDVKVIRSTSLDKRLQIKGGKDEINELAVTFNNLLEHLEQSFGAQRSFVAHASHELRTPVTSIIGDIEVTLSQNRNDTEYKETLEKVLAESEKLNDLINNLFDLAEANIDITEFQDIRLDELLWQVKDEWANRIQDSKIELKYNLPEESRKYTVQGNSYLLFIALGNILKNAIKFSNNNVVKCMLYMQHNTPVISIRDKGIGIDRNDIENIFQPFFRGANTFGYAGFGIGLSLSEKILRLHNARIYVQSELNKGTEFKIFFSN